MQPSVHTWPSSSRRASPHPRNPHSCKLPVPAFNYQLQETELWEDRWSFKTHTDTSLTHVSNVVCVFCNLYWDVFEQGWQNRGKKRDVDLQREMGYTLHKHPRSQRNRFYTQTQPLKIQNISYIDGSAFLWYLHHLSSLNDLHKK